MNRRLRGSSSSSPSSQIEERLHRFLRPGALARLRDSRISARLPRSIPATRLSPPSSPRPSVAPVAAAQFDGFLCFAPTSGGFRYLQRKRVLAPKFVFFAPSSPDVAELFLEAAAAATFGVDLVAAH